MQFAPDEPRRLPNKPRDGRMLRRAQTTLRYAYITHTLSVGSGTSVVRFVPLTPDTAASDGSPGRIALASAVVVAATGGRARLGATCRRTHAGHAKGIKRVRRVSADSAA